MANSNLEIKVTCGLDIDPQSVELTFKSKDYIVNDKTQEDNYVSKEYFKEVVGDFRKKIKVLKNENEQLIRLIKNIKTGYCVGCNLENKDWGVSKNTCLECGYSE